jgi:membrane protease subunit HflK
LGIDNSPEAATGDFLQYLESVGRSQYLTGDKNILHLQINTQYRVSEQATDDFLFHSAFPERHLERIVESVATDLLARSGVDFVHPLGQVELNRLLTEGVRHLAEEEGLGIDIDDVAINAVSPPLVVKSYFLDVTSARADKVNSINQAKAYAEQRRAAATGDVRRIADEAAGYRQQAIESARGEADSFTRMVEQLRSEGQSGKQSYAQARQIVLQRYYLDTMRDILKTVSAKVVLDSREPADLTIFGRPEPIKPPSTP